MLTLRLIVALTALTAGVASAQQFTAVPQSSGPGVWIINTETGEAKYCSPQGDGSGAYTLMCIKEPE